MSETDLPSGKLILLYMLSQVRSIPSSDLLDWAVESLYLDYFSFAQVKEELKNSRLMIEAQRKDENLLDAKGKRIDRCDITPEGELVLHQLLPTLPTHIRAYLSQSARKWQKQVHHHSSIVASYLPDANGAFQVRLSLFDGSRLTADLTLFAPDENTANKMCRHWKNSTADIYSVLLLKLTSDETSAAPLQEP